MPSCGPGGRRRAARAGGVGLSARAATPGSARCPGRDGPPRCGAGGLLADGGRRRGLPRHPHARPGRARRWPACSALRAPARRSCSSPPTRTTRSTRSTSRRCDYVLKPVGRSGWPRRSGGWSSRGGRLPRGRGRGPRAATYPGRARRRHAVRGPRRGAATSRRRATTRGCTPRAAATCCACRWPPWRSGGAARVSSVSTAGTWSRSARRGAAHRRGPLRWSASAAPSCRSAAATPASCGTCWSAGRGAASE